MSLCPCRHVLLGGPAGRRTGEWGEVRQCARHSRGVAGVGVWVWGEGVRRRIGCPCAVADRFLVVEERAAVRWRQSADVVIGRAQPTVGRAVRFAEAWLAAAPGGSLAAVPVGELGTVLQTRAEQVVLLHGAEGVRVCGVCVYPWVAAGRRIAELLEPISARIGTPRGR